MPLLVVVALVVIPYARVNLTAGHSGPERRGRTPLLAGLTAAILGLFGAFECWPIVIPSAGIWSRCSRPAGESAGAFAEAREPHLAMDHGLFAVVAGVLRLIGTSSADPACLRLALGSRDGLLGGGDACRCDACLR